MTLPLFCFSTVVFSQVSDSSAHATPVKPGRVFMRECTNLGRNFICQAKSPFLLKKKQLPYVLLGIAILSTTIYYDTNIHSYTSGYANNPDVKNVSPWLTRLGSGIGISAVALYGVTSWAAHYTKGRETFWYCAQTMITSAVWARIIKISAGKERPDYYYNMPSDHNKWHGFKPLDSDFHSFPSGHTNNAFAIATVLSMQYKNNIAVSIIAYTLAAAVGASRMIEARHWSSDVFAGACLGAMCGRQVVITGRKKKNVVSE
jgi:membrane-associated phospholipid phosphatase